MSNIIIQLQGVSDYVVCFRSTNAFRDCLCVQHIRCQHIVNFLIGLEHANNIAKMDNVNDLIAYAKRLQD